MRLKLTDSFNYIITISVLLFVITIIFMIAEPSSHTVNIPVDALLKLVDPNDYARIHGNDFKVADNGVPNSHNPVNDTSNAIKSTTHNPATGLTKPSVNLSYCENIINKRRDKALARLKTEIIRPPWVDLIISDNVTNNNSSSNFSNTVIPTSNITYHRNSNLYVHVFAAHTRRLGNQLFNYASLFGVAWRNQRIPLWPERKTQVRSAFNLRIPVDVKNAVIGNHESHFVKLREPGWAKYGQKTERLPNNNVSLTVFLQSWKYFLHVEDQLRIDFTFKSHIVEKARRFLDSKTPSEWKGTDFVRVVIHVRRGDHISKGMQNFGWSLAEPDYFNRSMAYFTNCLPRVQFVVLSNDIKWCRRNIVGRNVVYSGGRGPTDDMCIASLCDHAIVSIGSFSWWVAWFANGVTVTQKNFPKPNSKLLKRLSRTDYYKQEWVAL